MADEHYFARTGAHRFEPTRHVGGGWRADEQHISPMTGLIVHEVEAFVARRGDDGLVIGSVALDILGTIAMDAFTVDVAVLRPGRTIELIEALVTSRGRLAVRARVWRLLSSDTAAIEGGDAADLPGPEKLEPWVMSTLWEGGFVASLDIRRSAAAEGGAALSWLSTRVGLVDGERSSVLASYLALVDTTNGIAIRADPAHWMFPNVDLGIHLFRHPVDTLVGLDTRVSFGPAGVGLTSTTLFDRQGQIGRADQLLTVRAR